MQAASTHVFTLMLRSADLELAASTAAEQRVRLSSREAQADLTWRLGRLCAGVRSFDRWEMLALYLKACRAVHQVCWQEECV